ncbi:FAD-dependent oxidoreductase [Nocardioides hwasunensis]|uniref:FAD-dependent oxidoreductase n=1 Tax=Nocardioides hwasunensis TaxID=397258 RepID=A0ABR8MHL1_9ACTN|nr:FAD-dependent oxidoreductase [Nocardioides hwasunensis]MBD3915408.1 FAD-dependent oxidoreductase [Nocardioides hwasunensis]
MTRHERVFSPVDLGSVRLRNRVFVSAHTTNFGQDFLPTDRHVAYHRERARGGVGLIVTEPLRVHPTSLGRAGGLAAVPEALPGLERIVTAVRDEGAAIFTQVTHAGRHSENVFRRTAAWGPTSTRWSSSGGVPHAMTRRDMTEIVEAYVAAVRLAVRAGFQGVEVHFGHGHLLHQFISPASNTRTDAYGGSEEARLRFPLEVLDAVLDAVGDQVVVGVRMSADELVTGGQDLEAGRRIAHLLDTTRPIGFLNVSLASYTVPSIGHHVADMSEGHTPYLDDALAVAQECERVPVLAACRFLDLDDAERGLATGLLTAVAMTRAHIADPHLLRKADAGAEGTIRPCVSCNFCIGEIAGHRPMTCMMNPTVGREEEWPEPAPQAGRRRRLLVLGGGTAGMETARVAAERGHDVEVWESAPEPGGQLRVGRRGAGRADLDRLRAHLEGRLADLGVPVRADVEPTAADVVAHGADAVVLATGATHVARRVPGWGPAITGSDVLCRESWTDQTVLILDEDNGWVAASVAETAARRGATVHLVTAAGTPLSGVSEYSRMTYVERLRDLGVQLWAASRAELAGGTATISSGLHDGATDLDRVTHVVALDPPVPREELVEPLYAAGLELHPVGDVVAPRTLLEAMAEGHALGRAL